MILLIDNYDSFVYNLARYVRQLGEDTQVIRHDQLSLKQILALSFRAIILSPGPGRPEQAGILLELIQHLVGKVPILGICLGHQAIAQAFGARIIHAHTPMHGKASDIEHSGEAIFETLPSPLTVGRYHSLVIDPTTLPKQFKVIATTHVGEVMAISHRFAPVIGLQFHPESILTDHGYQLIKHFLLIKDTAYEC